MTALGGKRQVGMEKLDGRVFKQMILQAAIHLANNKDKVDALNVFPVPDGDTGTNMHLTFSSGANEIKKVTPDKISTITLHLSKGLLMGARGNSGVILSQLFRGFAKATEAKHALNAIEFASALGKGVETAYKAVMKPVEGTILTVAKDAANQAETVAKSTNNVIEVMNETVKEAKASLDRTPNLLPVLKEVGVVDSGGQGLVIIYEAFLAALEGKTLEEVNTHEPSMEDLIRAEHHKSVQSHISADEITYGYCTEFMIKLADSVRFHEDDFRHELSNRGDSLLVVSDEELVKIHIHSEYPGEVMTYSQKYGELMNIKIENMREQHSQIVNEENKNKQAEKKAPYGIVTVAAGEGVVELFESLGASEVIHGGQTMNPSTEDVVQAIERVNAETVFVLPNNGNVVMAAEQAAKVAANNVIVIPTKTIPQGMASLFVFNQETDVETNENEMKAALKDVKSGQVTYAVRDSVVNGVTINKNDYLSIFEGEIVSTSSESIEALQRLLKQMIDDDSELITIIYGDHIDKKQVEQIEAFLEADFPHFDYEVLNGKQPVYTFIVAVE